MRVVKIIVILVLLVWALITKAQTNNFWYHYKNGFSFDDNGSLNYLYGLTSNVYTSNNSSIADFNGFPLIYTNGNTLYNSKNQQITNGGSLFSYYNSLNSYYFLTLDTSNYLMYGSPLVQGNTNFYNDSLLYYSYIRRDTLSTSGFSIPAKSKNLLLQFNESILSLTACRNSQAQPVIIMRTKNSFYSFEIIHGGVLKLLDSMPYPENKIIPDSLSMNPLLRTNGVYSSMQCSNNGSFIAFNDYYDFDTKFMNSTYCYSYNRFIMTFDKQTGKFGTPKMISTFFWHKILTPLKDSKSYFDGSCFSTNDSFLYFHESYVDPKTYDGTHEDLYQYDVYGNILPLLINTRISKTTSSSILSLNHLGEIFFFNRSTTGSSMYLNKIKQPNNKYPKCFVQMQSETIPNAFSLGPESINQHLYDYIRTSKQIKYDCVAKVDYKNKSQPWIGFTDFTWHIKNDKGGVDYYKSFEPPQLEYAKNGDYPVKVFAYSPRGKGYGEWYIDTIKIRIPDKPVANFYAKDSTICRYTGLQFLNYSHAKDTVSNKYLWSFGDGNTSIEIAPKHVYTSPGIYTVSLFYRNGFCDSTLVKNQYIKVVDAPKPGFSVLYMQGCAPFTANFTDTVTLNVKQKDYYFSDGLGWQNVSLSTPNFIHTFKKPGSYRAVQRLIGYTGCVMQTDSVFFNVSKGFTQTDTLHVINSSVENKNAQLNWPRQDTAVFYQLYKNSSPYIKTKDTFFYETTTYTQDAIYSVKGIDSCGNYSSAGRIGKPMFLQGQMIGNNDASIIYFSPYQQWLGTDINYSVQKLIGGSWMGINSQKSNSAFNVFSFLNRSEVQACYRIEAFENSKPSLISHSNEVCIPYIPTLFVPTAFSPNDDGINDVYDITGFGLKSYTLTVYNRWGQLVFNGADKQAWDGSKAAEGVYLIMVHYTTNAGIKLNQRVTVNLLK